jgi:hypothetical protein
MYQAAGRDWRSAEAKQNVRTMSAKYPKFNRTGCAIMYLGQMAEGEERVRYLSEAIAKHGDCYFGNGVQVGSFARYLLGHAYLDQGKDVEARKLFDVVLKARRHDIGNPVDWLKTNIVFASRDPKTWEQIVPLLRSLIT